MKNKRDSIGKIQQIKNDICTKMNVLNAHKYRESIFFAQSYNEAVSRTFQNKRKSCVHSEFPNFSFENRWIKRFAVFPGMCTTIVYYKQCECNNLMFPLPLNTWTAIQKYVIDPNHLRVHMCDDVYKIRKADERQDKDSRNRKQYHCVLVWTDMYAFVLENQFDCVQNLMGTLTQNSNEIDTPKGFARNVLFFFAIPIHLIKHRVFWSLLFDV